MIDFEITANRPDCLSHIGLAREASAIWGLPLQRPTTSRVRVRERIRIRDAGTSGARARRSTCQSRRPICARVTARRSSTVKIAPSPDWLRDRLEAAGVRPINNVVDVTNYVMLELGQPMHAFDLDRLAGSRIVVRRAPAKETMRTLDGIDRALDPDMLVIADAERRGGDRRRHGRRELGDRRRRPHDRARERVLRADVGPRTSKRLGLKTEASTRFERGGDIEMPPLGIARAAELFEQIGAGVPSGHLIDRIPCRPAATIALRSSRIARLLGQAVPAADVAAVPRAARFRACTRATAASRSGR